MTTIAKFIYMVPESTTTLAEVPVIDICEIDIECNELKVCLVTGKKYFTKRIVFQQRTEQ